MDMKEIQKTIRGRSEIINLRDALLGLSRIPLTITLSSIACINQGISQKILNSQPNVFAFLIISRN